MKEQKILVNNLEFCGDVTVVNISETVMAEIMIAAI